MLAIYNLKSTSSFKFGHMMMHQLLHPVQVKTNATRTDVKHENIYFQNGLCHDHEVHTRQRRHPYTTQGTSFSIKDFSLSQEEEVKFFQKYLNNDLELSGFIPVRGGPRACLSSLIFVKRVS